MQRVCFLLALVVCLAAGAAAQTDKITEGTLKAFNKSGKSIGACPLKHTDVKTEISGFLARVRVTQEFENKFEQPIEAVYTFPLAPNSAVDDMTMKIGRRVIKAKIMQRAEAEKVYQTAKKAGQRASLLDQDRPNVFTQAVANLMPGDKIVIEISYVETLKYENGAYEFVFPMVTGERYIPASMRNQPVVSRLTPNFTETRAGHDISINVRIEAGVPIQKVRSTTHPISETGISPTVAEINLKTESVIPNKDFILCYDVAGGRIEDAVLAHADKRGGFFSLILQPPDKSVETEITPKEIVFVLDTSGSMSGFPIEKAKEAMRLALDGMHPRDTFNLITFAGETSILFEKPVPATKANLARAQEFLAGRVGAGGTEMMKAIRAALEPTDSQEHLRIVCFMTDGYVGNDMEIVGEIQKHPNARVFSFGIGSSVNRFLLDKMADAGRGEVEYVALNDDGSKAAKKFHERVRSPLLTDISIDWNGLPVTEIYPKKLVDLFSAKPLIIHGRYTKAMRGKIRLRGKTAGKPFVREIDVNFPAAKEDNDSLASLWARTKIDDLMSQDWEGVQNGTARKILQAKIVKLGLDYRLMTQFTSFVAVEERIVNRNGQPKRVDVPVENPEGVRHPLGEEAVAPDRISTGKRKPNKPAPPSGYRGAVSTDNKGVAAAGGVGNISRIEESDEPPPPPKVISSGVINGKAVNLVRPPYPAAARAVRASGTVAVQVTIDENGNVISASAVSGHPLLKQAAEQAARASKFAPTLLAGQKVKTTGVIVYNFSGDQETSTSSTTSAEEGPPPTEEMKKQIRLQQKLHPPLSELVKNPQMTVDFVTDGKAEVEIWLTAMTPEIIEKLRKLGVESIEEHAEGFVVGRVPVDKIIGLAEIEEVEYILPNAK